MRRLTLSTCLALLALTGIASADPPIDEDALPECAIARLGSRVRSFFEARAHTFIDGGRTLVTVHDGPQVFYRDVASGKFLRVRMLDKDYWDVLGLSSNGRILALWNKHQIVIWDLRSERIVRKIPFKLERDELREVYGPRLSADGLHVVMERGKTVVVYDAQTGASRLVLRSNDEDGFSWYGFGLDGRVLVTSDSSGSKCHEVESGNVVWSCKTKADHTWQVVPGGQLALFVSERKMRLFDLRNGKITDRQAHDDITAWYRYLLLDASSFCKQTKSGIELRDLYTNKVKTEFRSAVEAIAVTPDGRLLLGRDNYGKVQRWDVVSSRAKYAETTIPSHAGFVYGMVFRPDNQTLLSSDGERVILWDLKSRRAQRVIDCSTKHLEPQLLMTPNGGRLIRIVRSEAGLTLDTWEVDKPARNPAMEIRITVPEPSTPGGVVSSDGRTLYLAAWDEADHDYEQRWFAAVDLLSGKVKWERREAVGSDRGFGLAHGGSLYIGSRSGVHETLSGRLRMPLRLGKGENAWQEYFSRDLNRLAILQTDVENEDRSKIGGVHIYELPTGVALSVPTGQVSATHLTRDGRRLVVASHEAIHVWDTATRREIKRWSFLRPGHPVPSGGDCATCAAISPDGRLLATGHHDGTLLLWNMPAADASAPIKAGDHDSLWNDLASTDAGKAWAASARLMDSPAEGIALLKTRLKPTPAPAADQVRALLDGLAAREFARREAAGKELAAMLDIVEPALRAQLAKGDSPEQTQRIKQLLEQPPLLRDPERIRRWRSVIVLEQIGTPDARKLLEVIAQSPAGSVEEQAARAALRRLDEAAKQPARRAGSR